MIERVKFAGSLLARDRARMLGYKINITWKIKRWAKCGSDTNSVKGNRRLHCLYALVTVGRRFHPPRSREHLGRFECKYPG